jgi:hypothetical protein
MGKVYNLYRVKTDISAVLTVKSGLDPHMIICDISCICDVRHIFC